MKQLALKIFTVVITFGLLVPILPVKSTQAQTVPGATVIEFGPAAEKLVAGILSATGRTEISSGLTSIATGAIAATTGPAGGGAVTVNSLRASLTTIDPTCPVVIASLSVSGAVSTLLDVSSSATLEVLGGGAAEMTKIGAKLAQVTKAKLCVDGYVELLGKTPGVTLENGRELAREQDQYTKLKESLQATYDNLSARQNASVKDILKAFMVKVILNLNKTLTTQLVNKMVEKFKISDYLAYGNALATQVYSMKYINEHYSGDARQQMMIRSLLQSDKLPEKLKTVQSMANAKAREYLGQACNVANGGSNSSDTYFMKCLAAYGAPQANAQYHYDQALDQTQAAAVAGQASAAAEMSQSSFAPPRNCGGSLAEQQRIDGQFDKIETEKLIAEEAAEKLGRALTLVPPRTTQAEYNKARAAADQAIANANALEKQTNNPIIDICSAITSPASFVANGISDFLKQHLDQASQLQSDNLPFYANFLADVTSNFLTNILTGGKANSQVLKEAGVGALNGAIIGIAQTAGGGAGGSVWGSGSGESGVMEVYTVPHGQSSPKNGVLDPSKKYDLRINYKGIKDKGLVPVRVQISGAFQVNDTDGVISAADLTRDEISYGLTPIPDNNSSIEVVVYLQKVDGVEQTFTEHLVFKVKSSGGVAGVSIILPRGPEVSFR